MSNEIYIVAHTADWRPKDRSHKELQYVSGNENMLSTDKQFIRVFDDGLYSVSFAFVLCTYDAPSNRWCAIDILTKGGNVVLQQTLLVPAGGTAFGFSLAGLVFLAGTDQLGVQVRDIRGPGETKSGGVDVTDCVITVGGFKLLP